jgi:hypothetical protein
MPNFAVAGIIVLAIGYILWAPLQRALMAFLATVLLLPATVVLPNALSSGLTMPRLATIALALRVLIALRRGEMSPRALRPTVVHGAFYVFLGVALVNGVLLAAPTTSTAAAMGRWIDIAVQFVVFSLVLALVRTAGDVRQLVRGIVVLVGLSTTIAFIERITGHGWSHFVLGHLASQRASDAALPLVQRGGGYRVRAAAEYPLDFGWISAMVLGITLVVAVRSRRWLVRILPVAIVVVIYWSNTRSAFAGVGLVLLLLAAAAADGRVSAVAIAVLIVGGLVYLGVPSVRGSFSGAKQQGSTEIRQQRLPEIAHTLTKQPYHGLGLQGLVPLGFPATDASWLLIYAELGVVGVASFVALLIVLLAYCGAGLRAPPGADRSIAAGVLAGMLAGIAGAFAFNLFTQMEPALVFWILAALGVLMAERQLSPRAPVTIGRGRIALLPVALGLGFLLATFVPSHASVVAAFDAEPLSRLIPPTGSAVGFAGEIWLHSLCGTAHAVPLPAGAKVSCTDAHGSPGFGTLRVDARTLGTAKSAMATIRTAVESQLPGANVFPQMTSVGVPTWARTAPAWAATAAVVLVLFFPYWPRREEPLRAPPDRALVSA